MIHVRGTEVFTDRGDAVDPRHTARLVIATGLVSLHHSTMPRFLRTKAPERHCGTTILPSWGACSGTISAPRAPVTMQPRARSLPRRSTYHGRTRDGFFAGRVRPMVVQVDEVVPKVVQPAGEPPPAGTPVEVTLVGESLRVYQ